MSWSRLLTQTLVILGLGLGLVIFGLIFGAAPALVFGWFGVVASALWLSIGLVRAILERLLWRVGRRLLLSYLMLGLLPLPLLLGLQTVIGYVLSGQLAARRAQAELLDASRQLATAARELEFALADARDEDDWQRALSAPSAEIAGMGFAFLPQEPGSSVPEQGVLEQDAPGNGAAGNGAPQNGAPGNGAPGNGAVGTGIIDPTVLLPAGRVHTGLDAIGRVPGYGHALIHVRPTDRGPVLAYLPIEPYLRGWLHRRTRIGVAFPEAMVAPDEEIDDLTLSLPDGVRMTRRKAQDEESAAESGNDRDPTSVNELPADEPPADEPPADELPADEPPADESEPFWRDQPIPTGFGNLVDEPFVMWFRSVELPWIDWGAEDWHGAVEGRDDPFPMLVKTSFAREYVELFDTVTGDEANRQVASMVRGVTGTLVITILGVFVSAVLLAGFLVFRIASATRRLHDGFVQIEDGRFDHRVKLRGRDQLAALVRSFNRMVAHLEEATAERAERRALERELDLAHRLQKQLLPDRGARYPGFEIAIDFVPAAAIGGDFYHLLSRPSAGPSTSAEEDTPGPLTVAIADVSGHGLGTGIVMSAAQSLLAVLAEEAQPASQLLERLDRQLGSITDRRTFATLALCELDPAAGRAHVTNAGHLPPYRVRADGQVAAFGAPARPLGLPRLPARFETVETDTTEGDLWVFLSDGMIEATDDGGEMFGFDRFEALLVQCAGLRPGAALEILLAAWRRFSATATPEDDRTLLVVRVGEAVEDAET